MALLFIDSFDHYATADLSRKGYSVVNGGGTAPSITAAIGRNSTAGLRCPKTSTVENSVGLSVSGVSGAVCIVGFAAKVSAASIATPILQILNGSTANITVTVGTTGVINVLRGGANGTVLATSVSTISTGVYYFIEVKVTFSDTVGTYEVKVDGVSFVSGTGADTVASGSAGWSGIKLGVPPSSGNGALQVDYDDLYVCDGSGGANDDFLGDHRIVCVVASSGNGTNTDWSPSTGSDHGAVVDENPPNTSDYNMGSTAGQRDTYNFAALGVIGTVKAVQAVNLMRAEAAGVREAGAVVRTGSTNYDSAGVAVGSDWTYHRQIHLTDPSTASAWAVSGIDSAEFGVKVTA